MKQHECPDCGATHDQREPTPEERIAALEDRNRHLQETIEFLHGKVADLKADLASAETARELDRITGGSTHHCYPYIAPCTRPHLGEMWWPQPITVWSSGTITTSDSKTYRLGD